MIDYLSPIVPMICYKIKLLKKECITAKIVYESLRKSLSIIFLFICLNAILCIAVFYFE